MKKSLILYVIVLSICLLNTYSQVFASNVQEDPHKNSIEKNNSLPVNNNEQDSKEQVKVQDVYEALIKSKDDKILMLSNIVNWLLAIASILVAIITIIFGWLLNKIRSQRKSADKLINRLSEKEEGINKTQKSIQDFLDSIEFQEKINQMENDLSQVGVLIDRIVLEDQQKKEELRIRKLQNYCKSIEDKLKWFSEYNQIHVRINNPVDQDIYEKVKAFVALTPEEKETLTENNLQWLLSKINELIDKYRNDSDFFV
ncbi:hypothetical protein ACN9MH_07520 [Paenibacillus silvae]|jgi:hypothetical protein|uniref:hypothetical protein n=1 Tax=Paenibacillus silvae TaxID=1325358 RepID=UPI003CFB2B97